MEAIGQSQAVVGYKRYIDLVKDLIAGKEVVSSGMRQEVTRCREALALAAGGKTVSLISSGDPGIYGMAGLSMEVASQEGFDVPIEVIPGVTAASTAAARLGAPLMLDFACVSLSDLLVSREMIRRRLEALILADMVTVLYNPKSSTRVANLEEAAALFRKSRPGSTPVGIVTAGGTKKEEVVITDLDHFLDEPISMLSVIVIGNSSTEIMNGRMVTRRGYRL